jgi:hypothetical protein
VRVFAYRMEAKLDENRHKSEGPEGWLKDDPWSLPSNVG